MSTTPKARPAAVAVTEAMVEAARESLRHKTPLVDVHPNIVRAALEAAALARASQDHGGDAEMIGELERLMSDLKRLAAENDVLRASTANGLGPCIYCALPRSRWAECKHGFPGCPRSDDAMLCPHVGAELETADKLAAAEARAAKAVERVKALEGREAIFNAGLRLLWSDAVFVGSHWEEPLDPQKGVWPAICVHVSSYGADAEEVAQEHWRLLADMIDKHGEEAGEAYACWRRGVSEPGKGKLSKAGRDALAEFDCALAALLSDHPAPEPGVEAGRRGETTDGGRDG